MKSVISKELKIWGKPICGILCIGTPKTGTITFLSLMIGYKVFETRLGYPKFKYNPWIMRGSTLDKIVDRKGKGIKMFKSSVALIAGKLLIVAFNSNNI